MSLAPATRLGPYEIIALVGAGGMGEVYRARDTRLGRTVALKILPRRLADRPGHRERLEREARAVSSLNHPNICALYDVGRQDEVDFLVMEYLEGTSLARRLAAGPLPVGDALRVGWGVARALEYAHGRGVLHRDLKPANVQIIPDGTTKLLDFGLAKLGAEGTAEADSSRAPTRTPLATEAGAVLGTPDYMSPQQARGQEVDRRTDLWSLGCLLFEALSGRSPFRRETLTDTLVAVLEREPDWHLLPDGVPAPLRPVLRRCLEKDPERRPPSAGEVRQALEDALEHTLAASDRRGLGGRGAWALAAGLLGTGLLAAALLLWNRGGQPEPPAAAVMTQATFAPGVEEFPAWSPDGKRLAYSAEAGAVRKIFVTDLADGTARQLTRGEYDDMQPSWSPDGSRLLFVRARTPGRKLEPGDVFGEYDGGDVWSLDLADGTESPFLELAFSPAFAPDGSRVAVDAAWVGPHRIWLVDDRGRNPQQLTADPSEAVSHVRPRWSPDGTRIAVQGIERTQFDVRVVDVASRQMVRVTDDRFPSYMPVWSRSGRFLYYSSLWSGGLNIWRVEVGSDGAPIGRPRQLTTGPGQDVELAVSPDGGALAFAILKQNADLWRLPLSPDTGRPLGPPEELVATTREDSRGAWSPDGRRVAFNSDRGGAMNIWVRDLASGEEVQVTRGPGGDFQPNWSPDGRRLAFFSSRAGNPDIWVVAAQGGEPQQLTRGDASEVNPFFSPDGGRIAYHSDEGGRAEVWLMNADGSGARPLTRVGAAGHFLRWTADGRHVLFRCLCGGDTRIMRIAAEGGEPEALAEVVGGSHISLSPDESRILDVTGHKVLWISPLREGKPERIFEFDDPSARIDYPEWSPDGRWALFDRFRPEGGDIWLLQLPGHDS